MADPVHADDGERQREGEVVVAEASEALGQVLVGGVGRQLEVEHQQGDGDGEHAVAEASMRPVPSPAKAMDALGCGRLVTGPLSAPGRGAPCMVTPPRDGDGCGRSALDGSDRVLGAGRAAVHAGHPVERAALAHAIEEAGARRGEPAVDDERVAGDERRVVAGQEQRGAGDVARAVPCSGHGCSCRSARRAALGSPCRWRAA